MNKWTEQARLQVYQLRLRSWSGRVVHEAMNVVSAIESILSLAEEGIGDADEHRRNVQRHIQRLRRIV